MKIQEYVDICNRYIGGLINRNMVRWINRQIGRQIYVYMDGQIGETRQMDGYIQIYEQMLDRQIHV